MEKEKALIALKQEQFHTAEKYGIRNIEGQLRYITPYVSMVVAVGISPIRKLTFDGIDYYAKSSIKENFDNFEMFIYRISNIFNIDSAKIDRFVTDSGLSGIVSESIYDEQKEVFLKASFVIDNFFRDKKNSKQEENPLLKKALSIYDNLGSCYYAVENDLRAIIETPLLAVSFLYDLDEVTYTGIRKKYFKMLLFDFLIHQKDRNSGNYGFIKNEKKIKFAKLFDNAYLGNGDHDWITVNDKYCYREKLIECIYNNYYEDIRKISTEWLSKKDNNIVSVGKIAFSEMPNEVGKEYMKGFRYNYSYIEKLEKEKQNNKTGKAI